MTRVCALLVLTTFGVVACDKVPLTSPTGSTITLSVASTTVPINGTIEVIAAVIEAGGTAVHDGTSVTFTGGFGNFTPVEAQTVGGVARSFFRGTTSGTAKIGAFSGAAKATEVEVKVGAAAAGSIAISATPSSVSQSGGTVTVAALVLDASGNSLPGVNVNFSATTGQLSSPTALTDSSGIARTQLTTSQNSTVTATAGAATKDVTVTVSAAPTVTIDPPTPSPAIEGQPVAITVKTSSGTTAAPRQVQSLIVEFGDGSRETRTNVTGDVAFTHVYNNAGGYTITATAVDVAGNTGVGSRALTVQAATLPTVTLTATPNPVPNSANGLTTLTAGSTSPALRNVTIKLPSGEVLYSGTSGGSVAYRFPTPGTFTVIATATDANGNTGSTSITVITQ